MEYPKVLPQTSFSPNDGWASKRIDSFTCSQSLGYGNELNYDKIRQDLNKDVVKVSLINVIYTGGTIGMKSDSITGSLRPEPNYLLKALKKIDTFNDPLVDTKNIQNIFVLPQLVKGTRIAFILQEYNHLLDSSNCTFDNWISMAHDIQSYYEHFDAFIILHGTDTLAYAASSLSFILENLSKPVIITGSQIPICELRTDGRDNFLGALMIAAHPCKIPEVCVFFNKNLYRGNRVVKASSVHFNAFTTPNFPILAELSIDIKINERLIFEPIKENKFSICENLSNDVAILRIFPSISEKFIKDFFNSSVKGVILQSYGAGNVPSLRSDMIEAFKDASNRGIIIVNITQCYRGGVAPIYETGAQLLECGVIPGFDMTPEAALTKLSYILSKYPSQKQRREMMCTNIRGEVTIPKEFNLKEYPLFDKPAMTEELSELEKAVRHLKVTADTHNEWTNTMFASILVSALVNDDVSLVGYISENLFNYNDIVKKHDTKGWSILHYIIFYNAEKTFQHLRTLDSFRLVLEADSIRAIVEVEQSRKFRNTAFIQLILEEYKKLVTEDIFNLNMDKFGLSNRFPYLNNTLSS